MSKSSILKNLNSKTPPSLEIPDFKTTTFEDRIKSFLENLKKAGGEGFILSEKEIENKITSLFPDSKNIASIYDYKIANINPNNIFKIPRQNKCRNNPYKPK